MLGVGIPDGGNKRIRGGWWVYLLESMTRDLLYTGVTTDVARRLRQHNGLIQGGARFTRQGRPWVLTYVEGPLGKVEAHQREHAIKQLPRERKLALLVAPNGTETSI